LKKLALVTLILSAMPLAATAAYTGNMDKELAAKIESSDAKMEVVMTHKEPVSGLSMVRLSTSEIFLTNDNFDFIVGGQGQQIFTNEDGSFTNATKSANESFNLELVNELVGDSTITYKAPEEKYQVTVFVDPACGYCQKLHSEIDQYLELGITVNFAAFPVYGNNSKAILESAFSAKSFSEQSEIIKQAEATLSASRGQATLEQLDLPSSTTEAVDVVSKHTEAGRMLGLRGTPGIVLEHGEVIPSYVSAGDLNNYLIQTGQLSK